MKCMKREMGDEMKRKWAQRDEMKQNKNYKCYTMNLCD